MPPPPEEFALLDGAFERPPPEGFPVVLGHVLRTLRFLVLFLLAWCLLNSEVAKATKKTISIFSPPPPPPHSTPFYPPGNVGAAI